MTSSKFKCWGLIALALLALNHFTGTSVQAAEEADVKVVLKSDNLEYLRGEPIRLLAFVQQDDQKMLSITHPVNEPAAVFEYFQVAEDGTSISLGSNSRRFELFCGTPPIPQFLTWTLTPTSPDLFWTEQEPQSNQMRFRARLKPLHGSLAGKEFWSNEIEIAIRDPQGLDKTAIEAVRNPEGAPARSGRLSFIPNSASHHQRSAHETFVNQWSDSLFASYVRHIMARYLSYQDESAYLETLEKIVNDAPQQFPLRADAYVALLSHYKYINDLTQMMAVAQKAQKERVTSVNPETVANLTSLIADAETKYSQAGLLHKSVLTTAARGLADRHPITVAMTERFGKGRQPQSYKAHYIASDPVNETRQTWGMSFYDPRQSWALNTKYFVNDTGTLERIEFSGSLESYRTGPLESESDRIMQQYKLTQEDALKVFVQGAIEDRTIDWKLTFPDKRKVALSSQNNIPWVW